MSATKIEGKKPTVIHRNNHIKQKKKKEKNYNKTQKRYKYRKEREGVEAPKNVEQ